MKTTNGFVSLIFSSLFFLFTFNITQAEVCVKPTPPVCYTSKISVSEDYLGKDRQGSQWIEKTTTTSQVETNCEGSQKKIDYDIALTHYNVCLQVAETEARTLRNSNTQGQSVNQDTTVYTRVCPLPTQPEKQSSQYVVATNEFGNGTVIKQYGDGSYAIFNNMGEYEGIANSGMFDNAKNYQYAVKELAKSDNTPSRIVDLKDYAYLMNKNGESVQLSIDKRLSNINNCPTKKEKVSCPLNATPDKNNICRCDSGFGGGSGKNEGKCVPISQAQSEAGLFLYGNPNAHATDYGYACNDGYMANAENDKCLPVNNSVSRISNTPAVTTSTFTRTLKKGMSGNDVKQLQTLLQKLNYLPITQETSTYFGGITNNALIKFQKDNKIRPATGSFGPATQAKLLSLTK